MIDDDTFGENRQRYNARKLVADFFGVTEYEIRKAIKLAGVIPPLADILENNPRKGDTETCCTAEENQL